MKTASHAPWHRAFPLRADEWFHRISEPRNYAHDESAYDAQYRVDPANLIEGRGLVNLVTDRACDTAGPAVEIGCGTGLLSLGLAAESPFPAVLLTDPSPAFLDITRRKVNTLTPRPANVSYATLVAEEIGKLPAGELSLIAMRSTLHHVLDVEAFIHSASRTLRPGGALAFWEPCAEGYILMGALAQFIPLAAAHAGVPLKPEHAAVLAQFGRNMAWYVNRDESKIGCEDKHVFRTHEIARWADLAGLSTEFLPNYAFGNLAYKPFQKPHFRGFGWYLADYFEKAMSLDPALVAIVREHFTPYCVFLDELIKTESGPAITGVFLCTKRG